MARTKATLSGTARLADFLTVGYLAQQCPVRQTKDAISQARSVVGEALLKDLYESQVPKRILGIASSGSNPLTSRW